MNQRNPFANILPFIKELRIWLRAFKNKPKEENKKDEDKKIGKKKEEIRKNDDKTEEKKNSSDENSLKSLESFELQRRYSEFERNLCSMRATVFEDNNPFKEFIRNPSLPKFLQFENENKAEEEKKLENKPEKKETPKKERKMRILQNKEKKNEPSRITIFEKTLKEIANKTISLLTTQNLKFIEKNPFMEFKFDAIDISSLFT